MQSSARRRLTSRPPKRGSSAPPTLTRSLPVCQDQSLESTRPDRSTSSHPSRPRLRHAVESPVWGSEDQRNSAPLSCAAIRSKAGQQQQPGWPCTRALLPRLLEVEQARAPARWPRETDSGLAAAREAKTRSSSVARQDNLRQPALENSKSRAGDEPAQPSPPNLDVLRVEPRMNERGCAGSKMKPRTMVWTTISSRPRPGARGRQHRKTLAKSNIRTCRILPCQRGCKHKFGTLVPRLHMTQRGSWRVPG